MCPLAFVAGTSQGHSWGFISRKLVVLPIFFLTNVFIALKGTHSFYRRDRASLNYSISILLVWRKMLTSFMYRLIWAGSSEFGSYHLCEQRRFGRSCASPESQLLAQTSNDSRGTFRQKARSLAPLNDWTWAVKIFHDQECSKTQIRLTRPIFLR